MKKNVLVTGCSKGVGLSIIKTLIKEDYVVYGISRSITTELEGIIQEYPNNFQHLKYDLQDTFNIRQKIFREFIPNKIPLYSFVNNAAVAYDDIITNMNIDPLQKMFEINVFSPLLITKYAIRNMLLHHTKGSIIHLSSISVHTAYKGLSMYASTKGALEAFSRGTAREWGERGIRSNCLVAGFMETEMSSALSSEQKDRIYKRTSLKEATKVDSVASTIAFLLSSKAQSITGQNIHVDSGTI
jgi:3-oxoacyl-[acyl-carrier protein] reductase